MVGRTEAQAVRASAIVEVGSGAASQVCGWRVVGDSVRRAGLHSP